MKTVIRYFKLKHPKRYIDVIMIVNTTDIPSRHF